jgi:predicted metalloenzyme YecM
MNCTRFRVSVPDRPGSITKATDLAARLGVDVTDMEIDHELEHLVLSVPRADADAYETGLREFGILVSRADLDGDT